MGQMQYGYCGLTCNQVIRGSTPLCVHQNGALAQLGERHAGSVKVAGSTPAGSTKYFYTSQFEIISAGCLIAAEHELARTEK